MLSTPAYLVGRALWGVAIAAAAWRAGRQPVAVTAAVASDVGSSCLVLAFVRPEFRATLGQALIPVFLYTLLVEIWLLLERYDLWMGGTTDEAFSYAGVLGTPATVAWEVFAVAPPLFMGALLCFNS
jgi:hypothetical protein